jgi:hypothetical protein
MGGFSPPRTKNWLNSSTKEVLGTCSTSRYHSLRLKSRWTGIMSKAFQNAKSPHAVSNKIIFGRQAVHIEKLGLW